MMFFGNKTKPSLSLYKALIGIYGIGHSSAKDIIIKSGFAPNVKISSLDENEISVLSNSFQGIIYGKSLKNKTRRHMKHLLSQKDPRMVRIFQGKPAVRKKNCSTNGSTARNLNRGRFY